MHYSTFISTVFTFVAVSTAIDLKNPASLKNDIDSLLSAIPSNITDLYKSVPTCLQSCIKDVIEPEKVFLPCIGKKSLEDMAKCACSNVDLRKWRSDSFLDQCLRVEKDDGEEEEPETCDRKAAKKAINELVDYCKDLGVKVEDGDDIDDKSSLTPNSTVPTNTTITPGVNSTRPAPIGSSTPTQPAEDDSQEGDQKNEDDKDSGSVTFTVSSMLLGLGMFASVAFAL
ncbi:hypothetical protein BJ508DRAFT_360507 [Ascobolus immersus RN42]|uniref:Extracellular membrane protein CFEM domain-containing protein n=1 Tax=Ascobolus immersus RN42 TaxID=1160509 RepID=A0A3N4ICV7_ASCIM|nr:hypothetical protein BJ508DRAFT_360507 [Ascobolus immersus RN42]